MGLSLINEFQLNTFCYLADDMCTIHSKHGHHLVKKETSLFEIGNQINSKGGPNRFQKDD